jgi:hypothetical protein
MVPGTSDPLARLAHPGYRPSEIRPPVFFPCPYCEGLNSAPAERAGGGVKCGACHRSLSVPTYFAHEPPYLVAHDPEREEVRSLELRRKLLWLVFANVFSSGMRPSDEARRLETHLRSGRPLDEDPLRHAKFEELFISLRFKNTHAVVGVISRDSAEASACPWCGGLGGPWHWESHKYDEPPRTDAAEFETHYDERGEYLGHTRLPRTARTQVEDVTVWMICQSCHKEWVLRGQR